VSGSNLFISGGENSEHTTTVRKEDRGSSPGRCWDLYTVPVVTKKCWVIHTESGDAEQIVSMDRPRTNHTLYHDTKNF